LNLRGQGKLLWIDLHLGLFAAPPAAPVLVDETAAVLAVLAGLKFRSIVHIAHVCYLSLVKRPGKLLGE